jgi:hypothetical protein
MSLVEELHAQHKARLARMGAPSPYQAAYCPPPAPVGPPPDYPKFNIQTLYYHQMWFFDLITERAALAAERPKVEHIQRAVANFFGLSKNDLLSARRTLNVARPRQIGMYLCKTLTLQSLPEIGRRFGGRDHTTILHGIRKIQGLLPIDEKLNRDVESIKASLR